MEVVNLAPDVINVLDDCVYVVDIDTYQLYFMNSKLLNIVGNPSEDIWKSRPCYQVLFKKRKPCEFCVNHLIKEGEIYTWRFYNDYLMKWLSIQDTLVKYEGKNCHVCISSDISQYIDSETKLKEKIEEEKTLVQCIEVLHSAQSYTDSITDLLKIINNYYDADIVAIYEVNEEKTHLKNTHEYCSPLIPYIPLDNKELLPFGNFNFAFNSIRKLGYFYMPDLSSLDLQAQKNFAHLASLRNIRSLLTVPILDSDKSILGLLYIANPREKQEKVHLLLSIINFIKDFLDKNKLMQKLIKLSYYDDLTQLKNRHSYNDVLELLQATENHFLGIAFVTLNGLKAQNETRGQKFGDQIIISLAQILTSIFGESAFRIGGDEFVILDRYVTKDEFKQKITSFTNQIKNHEILSVSFGSVWSDSSKSPHKLIETSGGLMYIQKQAYYDSALSQKKYKNALAMNLYSEIENDQFELYFQPQVNFATKKFIGVETLIRKYDTDGNLQSPYSFIPIYEREGVIPVLDLFVFEKACETLQKWNNRGYRQDFTVSINISRDTLKDKNLIRDLLLIIHEYNIDISRIVIEVTETVDGLEQAALARIINDFQKAGFAVAIDDFGSGHSNFSVLSSVECREVKIDKSLVDNLSDVKTQMLIKHMIQIFEEMNINYAVAEGVETEEQFEILKKLNCTTAQGYFIDKPLPENELVKKYLK